MELRILEGLSGEAYKRSAQGSHEVPHMAAGNEKGTAHKSWKIGRTDCLRYGGRRNKCNVDMEEQLSNSDGLVTPYGTIWTHERVEK